MVKYVSIEHLVENFNHWKNIFDEHEPFRQRYGIKEILVTRIENNDNNIVILFEIDSAQKAREFLGSDNLRQTMARARVIGEPRIVFLNSF